MHNKTSAIVLNAKKYSDKAIIVNVYSMHFGRTSYLVYGMNNKKSNFRPAFSQALTLVDIDVVHAPKKDIQSIKDIRISHPFTGIPFHPIRNSLALFVSEIIYRTLQHSEPDEHLYQFLEDSIKELDTCSKGLANFHLVFLLKLSRYLGFEPNNDDISERYFDLMNGVFTEKQPLHQHFLNEEQSTLFLKIVKCNYQNMDSIHMTREIRSKMLENIIEFYKLHISDFKGLNSLSVLQELFD
jgi:DNA repair protein RecO (recombination protein O)